MLARLHTILFLLLGTIGYGQVSYPVSWHNVRKSIITGNTVTHDPAMNGAAIAASEQVLFGRGIGNVYSGSFSYTIEAPTQSPGEAKEIGYAPIDDPDVASDQIVYGFSFAKNYKVTMYSPEGSVTLPYSTAITVTLRRDDGTMRYLIDGVEEYSTIVSTNESLEIRAKIKTNTGAITGVTSSYVTTQFTVDPIIDNPNKTITINVTGANPPYRIAWFNGDRCSTCNGSSTTIKTEGSVSLSIADAAGNKELRMFSVGQLVSWSDLYFTDFDISNNAGQLTHHTLSNSSGNNRWGSGKATINFAGTSTTWAEYIVSEEQGEKAFGFCNAGATIRKTKDLNAGFVIADGDLQIIESGNILFSTTYRAKDALHLRYVNGHVQWLQNGAEIYSTSLGINGDITLGALVRGTGILRDVNYSTNQPALVNSTWDNASETGSITVNLSSITGVTGPFHYMIGTEPVPHLNETYAFINDSLQIDVDSVAFYTGNSSSTSKIYNELPSGTYFVTAFDSNGKRLFSQEVHLQGEFTFESQSNLSAIGKVITTVGQNDGFGTLEAYLFNGDEASLQVSFDKKGISYVGFAAEAATVSSQTDLSYGFYLDNNKLYTIENGQLSSTYIIYRRNEKLELKTDGTVSMEYYHNGRLVQTAGLPIGDFVLKGAIGLKKGQLAKVLMKKLKKKKFTINVRIDSNKTCAGNNGGFSFKVNSIANLNGAQINYSILNVETAQIVASGIVADNSWLTLTQDLSGDPLPGGIYLSTGTINIGQQSVPFSQQIFFGYESTWSESDKYTFVPNTYSFERNSVLPDTYAYAKSANILAADQTGWVEFKTEMTSSLQDYKGPVNVITFKPLNSSASYFNAFVAPYLMLFPNNGNALNPNGFTMVYVSQSGVQSFPTNNLNQIRIKLNATTIEVYDAGQLKMSANRPSGDLNILCNSANSGLGFKDVLCSFGCSRPCKSPEVYPDGKNTLNYPISGVYTATGLPVEICPQDTRVLSVAGLSNYARWSTTSGTLSCTECLTTTYTSLGVTATITVDLYEDPSLYLAGNSENSCTSYTFNLVVGSCPVDPCYFGDVVVSNGTNPVEYSPCDVPQINLNNSLFYSWSPQIGLSCYDCADPTFLLADIQNNAIPPSYTVKAYQSALDQSLDRFCAEMTVSTLKKYCAEDCDFEVTVDPINLSGLCVGDIVVLMATGEGSFNWTAPAGLNCSNCPTVFYTVQAGSVQIEMDVLNSEGQLCGEFDLEVIADPNCLNVDGISYNNYGVNTYVKEAAGGGETYLNIHGSVLNEVVDIANTVVKGTFINESFIVVTKDWINNGLNDFFELAPSYGTEKLTGTYQRIRGISPTRFYDLKLEGQGVKEMFVHAYSRNSLDLTLNELSTRDNTMYCLNPDPVTVMRTSGFVSSNLPGGGFSREMTMGQPVYLYPVGSSLGTVRYRPIEVEAAQNDAIKTRLVNYNPVYDALVDLAADVQSINDRFYHEVASNQNGNHAITFHYFSAVDGNYQHIAQYESLNPTDFWQKTGPIALGSSTQFPNTNYITTIWDDYDGIPFSLANAGFIIDWGDFGNPDGSGTGGDVVVTVTSNGGTSNGGGLGSPNETGNDPQNPNGGSGLFTPAPVAGTYTISVDGGECIEGGNIVFTVDNAGNIVEESIFFSKGNVFQPLSESLYTLASATNGGGNAIFDINSIPASVFTECTDDVKIVLSDRISLIAGDPLIVNAPIDFAVVSIDIVDAFGTNVGTSTTNTWNSTGAIPGLHYYEVILDNSGTLITLKGQFIII